MAKIYKHDNGRRIDFRVENDSGALSVAAVDAVDAIVADDRQNDEIFVKNHQAVLLTLSGDISFNARLILGGDLTKDENAEWIAKVSGRLNVGGEGILVCGGFDPRFLAEWKERIAEEEAYMHLFKVPPGEYSLDIYTLHGVLPALEEEWPQRIGSWFRESYPGQPFPAWLALYLRDFADSDPGHEKEWENLEKSIKSKKIAVEKEAYGVVDYIFHMKKIEPGSQEPGCPEGGWHDYTDGVRIPLRCPRGVRYMGKDEDVESFLEEISS